MDVHSSLYIDHKRCDWRNRTACFLGCSSGFALIEHVVLLGILVCCLLVGSRFLGTRVYGGLQHVLTNSGSVDQGPTAGSTSSAAPSAPVHVPPSGGDRAIAVWPLASEFVAIAALLALWCVMRKLRRQKELFEGENQVPPAPDSPQMHRDLQLKRQAIYRILTSELKSVLSSHMVVRHLMSQNLTTVEPSASREQVVVNLDTSKIRHLLVCDEDRHLVGIISDRDLLRHSQATTAEQIMTADPLTVTAESPVSLAVTILMNKRFSCLPVVDSHGRLCAVLTTTDLILALQCLLRILHEACASLGNPYSDDQFAECGAAEHVEAVASGV